MHRKSVRNIERIDYKIYSETGKKVAKEKDLEKVTENFEKLSKSENYQKLSKMVASKLVDEEIKVCLKFDRFLKEYEFDLLFDVEDIEAAIIEVKTLIDTFEDIHVELKRELDDKYEEAYPKFSEKLKPMIDWVKNAKIEKKRKKVEKLREEREKEEIEERVRKDKEENEEKFRIEKEVKEEKVRIEREEREEKFRELEKADQLRKEIELKDNTEKKEKERLRTAQRHLNVRINLELESIEKENSVFIEDMEKNINYIRELIKEQSELFAQIENVFADEYQKEFSEIYEKQNSRLYNFLTVIREMSKKRKLEEAKIKEEAEKIKSLNESQNLFRENNEKICIFNSIFSNIKERVLLFKSKYDIVLQDLSDSEILKKFNEFKTLDSEFSEMLNWITKLVKASPSNYDKTDQILNQCNTAMEKLKSLRILYKQNLDVEMKKRDLSEEKMRNASILGIKLPKFKGYESPMDFYTFKAEFDKLIAPRVSSTLLPDYLKNNYLEGQALQIVKEIQDLDEIWDRLKLSFGNVNTLLANKIQDIEKSSPLWRVKSDEKLVQALTKIRNCMMELSSLAEKHNIQTSLFHTSNVAKIYFLIGRRRQAEIVKKLLDIAPTDQEVWDVIIKFLDKELRVKEQILLLDKCHPGKFDGSVKKNNGGDSSNNTYNTSSTNNKKCVICEKTDHVPTITSRGNQIINYFACEKFVKMSTKERFEELKKKKLCFQCLTPGKKPKHEGTCFDIYKCPHESHKKFQSGLHVLICDRHKENKENKELLEAYKVKYISSTSHRDFSKNIGISYVDGSYKTEVEDCEGLEMAMYMLQTVKVGDQYLNFFYDSGCGDMVCRKGAVDKLIVQDRAKNIVSGPIVISGVGDKKSICEHGRYHLTIPLYDGTNVNLSGICLNKITSTFPKYPLKEIEKDIHHAISITGGDPKTLPKLPKSVGGDTDIMIGIQYLKYYPVKKFNLPNGLSIYESQFANPDGSRGIVGGPHRIVSEIHKKLGNNYVNTIAYFESLTQIYKNGYQLSLDTSHLYVKENAFPCHDEILSNTEFLSIEREFTIDTKTTDSENASPRDENVVNDLESLSTERNSTIDKNIGDSKTLFSYDDTLLNDLELLSVESSPVDKQVNISNEPENDTYLAKRQPKNLRKFEEIESAGTEISYRCVRCRGCSDCLNNKNVECISIQEEVEQEMINKSVTVQLDKSRTKALLPFLSDPAKKLVRNDDIAKKVYFGQTKYFKNNPEDKASVIKAEKKLHDLGFVDFVENLLIEDQKLIFSSPVLYFLPWRVVFNSNSLSTPCRPVFDASQPTRSGYSLNDLLAKGKNNMNQLLQIFIRWRIRTCAYHTDFMTMYNKVFLEKEHWRYQLYYFHNSLDPNVEPLIKVVKTLIYGVKSSGNQAERGIRETARLQKIEYPKQHEVVNDDVYVDDCLSGENTIEEAKKVTDDLAIVLSRGGFHLKGVTFSGFDPPENLSNGDNSINVAGLKWFPKLDLLLLNVSDLNFSKKHRGKKKESFTGILPGKFTRRNCAGRAAEVFDLVGRFTPITAGIKLDLNELCLRGLDWDDVIPDDLVNQWKNNFDMISKLNNIKFRRVIVPEDAVNLDMETIEMSDASPNLACSAVYARFRRKNGGYSNQLLFARSKIIPKGMSIPRAELFAAVLNATTGHIVSSALKKYLKNRVKLTDSQIVMYWINNSQLQLKQWVRNRVIEIHRLTKRENWFYVESKNMTADLGTRKGAKISDVSENSRWVNGEDWAKCERSQFPIKSYDELKLSKDDLTGYRDELLKSDVMDNEWINKQLSKSYTESYAVIDKGVLGKIGERYSFSRYVIDPNKLRFRKVVRILSIVILFVKNLNTRVNRISNLESGESELPAQFKCVNDMYLVTQGSNYFPFNCKEGLVVKLSDENLKCALNYFFLKGSFEIKQFQNKSAYINISKEKNGILLYTGRILASQKINNKLNLSDVCLDLSMTSFCVPLIDKFSPLAYSIVNEIHWYNDDARHSGNETVMRFVKKVAHIIEGRALVQQFRAQCPRCRYLNKKSIDVAMGPISDDNLCVAPAFYVSQVDIFGPFSSYSYVNKRASVKIWFIIFCCCTTGAVDIKVMENYSTTSFVLSFIRFSCKVGYPKKLLPDAGSQLLNGCKNMQLKFSDVHSRLHEYGVMFEVCPVGAHYMHGRVERKIKHVKDSFEKCLNNHRLSIIQWETLGDQVANSINNLPIGIGNVTKDLENIDLITPNRLLLARNNDRCPVGTLNVTEDLHKIIQGNNDLLSVWFKAWLISCVPNLMFQPKWFRSDSDPKVGDVVLFLKSEKDFQKIYQFGMIIAVKKSRDLKIREIEIEYQNANEKVKRRTTRGTREVVVIHPVDELGLVRELNLLTKDFF